MLVPLLLLSIPLLTEAPLTPANNYSCQPNGVTCASVSDTVSNNEVALTAGLLDAFIALKKDLGAFWKSHKELQDSALATQHPFSVEAGGHSVSATVVDYPLLTKKYPTLAGIFQKDKFAPEQFAPVQKDVMTALARIVVENATGDSQTVSGKNITLVTAYREKLRAIGVDVKLKQQGGGGDEDINP